MYSNPPMDYLYLTPSPHQWSIPPTYPTNPSFTTPTTPSFPSFPWEIFSSYSTNPHVTTPYLYFNHGYTPPPPNPYASYSSSHYPFYYNNHHQPLQPTKTYHTIKKDFEKHLQVSHPYFKKRSKKTSQKVQFCNYLEHDVGNRNLKRKHKHRESNQLFLSIPSSHIVPVCFEVVENGAAKAKAIRVCEKSLENERHQPIRGSFIQQILRVVTESHTSVTKTNKEWQENRLSSTRTVLDLSFNKNFEGFQKTEETDSVREISPLDPPPTSIFEEPPVPPPHRAALSAVVNREIDDSVLEKDESLKFKEVTFFLDSFVNNISVIVEETPRVKPVKQSKQLILNELGGYNDSSSLSIPAQKNNHSLSWFDFAIPRKPPDPIGFGSLYYAIGESRKSNGNGLSYVAHNVFDEIPLPTILLFYSNTIIFQDIALEAARNDTVLLKNLALMGVSCGDQGKLTITDAGVNLIMGAFAVDLLDLLAQMEHFDVLPNTVSFNFVLKAMHQVGEMLAVQKLFKQMLQSGNAVVLDDESYDLVIGMLFSTDQIDAAFKYIDFTLKHGRTNNSELLGAAWAILDWSLCKEKVSANFLLQKAYNNLNFKDLKLEIPKLFIGGLIHGFGNLKATAENRPLVTQDKFPVIIVQFKQWNPGVILEP